MWIKVYKRIYRDRTTIRILEQYREIVEKSPNIIYIYSTLKGGIYYSNRVEDTLGYSPQYLLANPLVWQNAIHLEDLPKVMLALYNATGEYHTPIDIEYRMKDIGGGYHWISDRSVAITRVRETSEFIIKGLAFDITERKSTESILRLSASVFSNAREGIVITDTSGTIVETNEAFTLITGYPRNEVIGNNLRMLKSGKQPIEFYHHMFKTLSEKGHWYGELWNIRKNGEIYAEMLAISSVKNDKGSITNYVGLFSDITHVKKHQQQLEHIAHYDPLTGLPNKVLLIDRMNQAISQSDRRLESVAIIYMDLDSFKLINDAYGHSIGDALLLEISSRLKKVLREGDTLARVGGDEFVILLANLTEGVDYQSILTRILYITSEPIKIKEDVIVISFSLGVTLYPTDKGDSELLLRHADQALYQAKQQGKNRYHLFNVIEDTAVRNHRESLEEIHLGFERSEFVLYYQAQVDVNRKIVGVEALIRWNHPDKGLVAPGMFLPLIEDHPLSVAIGDWVIRTALDQIKEWRSMGINMPISVNLGARQLQQSDFVQKLISTLSHYEDAIVQQLKFEILETSALVDIGHVTNVMGSCKELGIFFALDDFGTGYSSLSYLNKFKLDFLKIDQSFVRNLDTNNNDMTLCEAIIVMAHKLGMKVVAEGIETETQFKLLFASGCDLGQGYLFSKPISADRFIKKFYPNL